MSDRPSLLGVSHTFDPLELIAETVRKWNKGEVEIRAAIDQIDRMLRNYGYDTGGNEEDDSD